MLKHLTGLKWKLWEYFLDDILISLVTVHWERRAHGWVNYSVDFRQQLALEQSDPRIIVTEEKLVRFHEIFLI